MTVIKVQQNHDIYHAIEATSCDLRGGKHSIKIASQLTRRCVRHIVSSVEGRGINPDSLESIAT